MGAYWKAVLAKLRAIYKAIRSDQALQFRQVSLLAGVVILVLIVLVQVLAYSSSHTGASAPKGHAKPVRISHASASLPSEEIWVKRMEKQAKSMRAEKDALQKQMSVMTQQVKLLQEAVNTMAVRKSKDFIRKASGKGGMDSVSIPPAHGPLLPGQPQQGLAHEVIKAPVKKLGFVRLAEAQTENPEIKSVDTWLPAGGHVSGVMTSGVAASTATGASSNPQPVVIRLSDHGEAARKWRLQFKDARVLAACHGDLSSERVYCRLSRISYTEPSGEVVEKPIEGWVFGNDGKYGLRGHVVDKADKLILHSLFAGMLGSVSSYLQAQSSKGVFPVSPYGQTNAMSEKEMLKGASATGAGNAMDRMAKYLIERAESMSPVVVVNAGRVVDIVIKSGVDFAGSSQFITHVKAASDPLRASFARARAQMRINTIQKESGK